MDIMFLMDYINVITMGICLCVGFAFKQAFAGFNNRYIPLGMLILGTIINCIMNSNDISAAVVLGGMISGLASTGLYEMLRNLIHAGENPENKK